MKFITYYFAFSNANWPYKMALLAILFCAWLSVTFQTLFFAEFELKIKLFQTIIFTYKFGHEAWLVHSLNYFN